MTVYRHRWLFATRRRLAGMAVFLAVASVTATATTLVVNIVWGPDTAAYSASAITMGDGVWVAGTDMPAGNWNATAPGGTGPGCYYDVTHDDVDRPFLATRRQELAVYLGYGDSIDTGGCGLWTYQR